MCKPVFEQPRRFKHRKTIELKSFKGESLAIELDGLKIILGDQHQVLINGLVINAAIVDPEILQSTAGNKKNAVNRVSPILDMWLRVALGGIFAEQIEEFNFWRSIEGDTRLQEKIGSLGLKIVSINVQNARFALNEARCEN